MSETTYCPTDWVGEDCPGTVSHPDQLIQTVGNALLHAHIGSHWVLAFGQDPIEDTKHNTLQPGDIVFFSEHRDHGKWTIRVQPNGSYSGVEGIHPEANCFSLEYDGGFVHATIADAIKELIEEDDAVTEETDLTLAAWYWSEPAGWRFEVTESGPRFVKVES